MTKEMFRAKKGHTAVMVSRRVMSFFAIVKSVFATQQLVLHSQLSLLNASHTMRWTLVVMITLF